MQAYNDIDSDDPLQAAHLLGQVMDNIVKSLETCSGIDAELDHTRALATQFRAPDFDTTVTNSWKRWHSVYKEYVAMARDSYDNQGWFDAGQGTHVIANSFTTLSDSEEVEGTLTDAVALLGGFLEGFILDNHLDEIKQCMFDIESEGQEVM